MSDFVSNELADYINFVVVEIIDKPLDIDAFQIGVDAGGLDELCIIVDADAICYADIFGDFVDVS